MTGSKDEVHIINYKVLAMVYAALIALTAVTITVARMRLGYLSTFTAVFIATVKAGLVLYFFMHLKYERPVFKIMALVTIATLMVIILLTFVDVWYRAV